MMAHYSVRLILLACIFFLSVEARPVQAQPVQARTDLEDVFDGIYFGLMLGTIFPHGADDRFRSRPDPDSSDDVQITRIDDNGFEINLALGTRLDFGWPVWMRSALALGWQRYAVKGRCRPAGDCSIPQEDGASRAFSLLWHNYFHPLDKHLPHQIWAGLGLGASFAEAQLQNGSGVSSLGGVNFEAMMSVGYDYLILERSRFSDEYLLLGVSYRYMFAEGFRRELQSQVMVSVSYGF